MRYEQFADATIDQILSPEQLTSAKKLSVFTLSSVLLTNDGSGKFTTSPLPLEIQYTPVQAMLVEDLDGDGRDDVLVSGNFFSYRVEYGPFDASYGSVLKYGEKGFTCTPAASLGAYLKGDSRDLQALHTKHCWLFVLVSNNDSKAQVLRVNAHTSRPTTLAKVKPH